MRIQDSICIAPRYMRSVNLERDVAEAFAVSGYILTPVGVDFIRRVCRSLHGPDPRSWSITGPYGSGKSAFVLFLLNLLRGKKSCGIVESKEILKQTAPDIWSELYDQRKSTALRAAGFLPVLVSGSPRSIASSILEAVLRDVPRFSSTKAHRFPALAVLHKLQKEYKQGVPIDLQALVTSLLQLKAELRKAGKCQGMILVVDELGKFLEFAAHNPEQNDLFLLQLLAEATGASSDFLLLTILHQAFEQYGSGLRPTLRNEWAKIQGRFEDVGFQDPPEETLRIIGNAIVQKPSSFTDSLRKESSAIAAEIYDLGCAPRSLTKRQFCDLMAACAPLHPVTALVLTRLCRKFGQNQRSLFSFLTSRSTYGFATFIQREVSPTDSTLFSLAELYDYASDALGSGLSVGEAGTRWTAVAAALEARRDLTPSETKAVKAIGLLHVIGPHGELKASRDLLPLVLGTREALTTCEALQRRSVLVYRRHSSCFALWEGSDIDLDERLEDAARRVSPKASLAARITSRYAARPLVAKRHSFSTGTLRYFRVRFADVATFGRALERDDDADGIVVYALPNRAAEHEELNRLATSSEARDRVDVVIAVPKSVDSLVACFRDLELLKWVEENTPTLQSDAVARKELRARLQTAIATVDAEINRLFAPTESPATEWFHRGIEQGINSARRLSQLLSDICDHVYRATPRIKNELLNRRALSSAAAKARRNLIEAIITQADQPNLGISGFPPELSMYRSMVELNGMHRHDDDSYLLAAPYSNSSIHPAWEAMEQFFKESELGKKPIKELFHRLRQPPFGMKMGVIPVLFCVAAMVRDTEIAIYEAGVFVPEVTVDVFERLLKAPEHFELRSYRIQGVRKAVFREYAKLLGAPVVRSENLVTIIKPLYRFFNRLQDFTKRTASLSPKAIAIREALLAARDPDQILFHDLPIACRFEPFDATKAGPARVHKFFHELQLGFVELQKCYDDLLSRLQQLLYQALDIKDANARAALQRRAAAIGEYAIEPRTKAFIMHLCAEDLEEVPWIEAIGALLAGKPPKAWNDADRARYEVTISELSRNLKHIEALVFELARSEVARDTAAEVFRIGITDRHSKELEAVVSIGSKDLAVFTKTILDLESVLEANGLAETPTLSLAVLAAVSKGFLSRLGEIASPPIRVAVSP